MLKLDLAIPAFAAAALLCARASHADEVRWEPLSSITRAAHDYAENHSLENSAITVGALDARLHLPACEQPLQADAVGEAKGHGSYSVSVRCASGTAWTIYVPVKVDEHLQVLVLRRPVGRGERITPDHVELREAEGASTAYGYFTVSEQAVGKLAKRALAPGMVLTPDALEAPRAIVRGQRVTLLGRSGSLEVHADGKALTDAAEGERIKVENAGSRRVVEGVAHASGVVEVTL